MTVAEKFGRNLFMARRRSGLSQEELAIRAELHRTEISLLEKGRRMPRLDTLARARGRRRSPRPPTSYAGSHGCPETLPEARDVGATLWAMAKRSKKPADLNRLAAAIVDQATNERLPEPESQQAQSGRLGGRKGGKTRAARMTSEERSESARRAAKARWTNP